MMANLDEMRDWVTSNFPGRWENAQKTDWLTSSPFREDKHPSFSISVEKRCAYDRATGESWKLSELCKELRIAEPDFRKKDNFHSRGEYQATAVINKNALIAGSRWKKAQPAPADFPYLLKKQVSSYGLKSDTDRELGQVLLIPAINVNGEVEGIERIAEDGTKKHLGTKKGCYFLIGEPQEGKEILVAEGYATSASLFEITSKTVACAFSANNMTAVSEVLKNRYSATPVICTDAGEAGRKVADKALQEGIKVITTPDGTPAGQDWNDILCTHGLDKTRKMFQEQEQNCPEPVEKIRSGFRVEKINAKELYRTPLPEMVWVVDQLIPQGLSVLASPPKTGKSFFVLQVAIAVARGENFLGLKTNKGKVLLLSLEDSLSRLRKRIVKVMNDTSKIPDNLDLVIDFPRLDEAGLECLEKQIADNGYSLVVVDTWGKTKPHGQGKRGENVFETDVRLVAKVKKVSDNHGMAILLSHHLKKGGGASKDWLESLSGSMGLSATVDGLLALERERGADMAVLKRSGRDLEDDSDIALNWLAPGWEVCENAKELKLNASRKEILASIERAGEPVSPSYISTDIEMPAGSVRWNLMIMTREGVVRVTTDRKYMIPQREIIDDDDDKKCVVFSNSTNGANATNGTNATNATNVGTITTTTNAITNGHLVSDDKGLGSDRWCVGSVGDNGDIDSSPCGETNLGHPDNLGHCPDIPNLSGEVEDDDGSDSKVTEVIFRTAEPEPIADSSPRGEEIAPAKYDEETAEKWLDENPEAKGVYQQKFDNMNKTMGEAISKEIALLRTWEHFHRKEVA